MYEAPRRLQNERIAIGGYLRDRRRVERMRWIARSADAAALPFFPYEDSTRTDFRVADGTRSDTRRISIPTRLFFSS